MAALITYVDSDFKESFTKTAKARGFSVAELLRVAAQMVIEGQGENPAPVAPVPESSELAPMTVWMPRFLKDASKERAQKKGMRPGPFVAALVQTHLMRSPVLSDCEIEALQASNRELAAIGRNINQIAKALNEDFYETERVRLEKLAELSESIAANRAAIRALVRSSQRAWGVDDGLD